MEGDYCTAWVVAGQLLFLCDRLPPPCSPFLQPAQQVSFLSLLLSPFLPSSLCRCLQSEDSERSQLEYTQQLLLGALLSICDQLTQQGTEEARGMHTLCSLREHIMCCCFSLALMPESVFNMELVVQCVRLSSNPLTHHHALLLLTSAAALYPVCTVT